MGEALGKFTIVDIALLDSSTQLAAHILVKIYVRHWLFEFINLAVGDCSYIHPLDYLNTPFCCTCCHCYGHFLAK